MQFWLYKQCVMEKKCEVLLPYLFSASALSGSNVSTFVHYTSKKKNVGPLESPAESSSIDQMSRKHDLWGQIERSGFIHLEKGDADGGITMWYQSSDM